MLELIGGLLGLLIGSFLNVCIYRWPRDLSVVRPRSKCPVCEKQIAWYDNIPVVSYLLLRARCRACGAAFSWRYPVVELLTGLVFAGFVHRYGMSLEAAKYCCFSAILIGLAFADMETRLLPDELTVGGLLLGLLFSVFVPMPDTTFNLPSLAQSILGAVLCSGILWLAGWLFEKLRHKEGLGFGDVKMLAMAGAFLGTQGALQTIILGSLFGSVLGLSWIKLTGKDASSYQLPFGTFLSMAAMLVAFEGPRLSGLYERLVTSP